MNHWIVPPGHHIYTTEITPQLNLPFDTDHSLCHDATFIHSREEWNCVDLTTGTTIFRLNSQDWPDRVGVALRRRVQVDRRAFRFNAIIATSFRQSMITLDRRRNGCDGDPLLFTFWRRI